MFVLYVSVLFCIRRDPGVVGRAHELDGSLSEWKSADRLCSDGSMVRVAE